MWVGSGTRTHTLKAREPKGDVTLVKDFKNPNIIGSLFQRFKRYSGRDRPNTC